MTIATHTQCGLETGQRARLSIVARIRHAWGLARQRRTLRRLDAHMLRDIGITPEAAQQEAARPIWDVPRHWRQ
ncbi:DUF1127 domain-containing protein [Yoonia vestfoldensis]|uniref:DUF1127 domain-containing protein n=1 Tax=Yoonia vestfoldensis TaxID=245188 RepID=UPI0009D9D980|nr:DUF1127 domain-containing protein [Yoonia vestfoldensis]